MKLILMATALMLMLLLPAARPASAAGYKEFMTPVTDLPAGADALAGPDTALCHLVRKYHFLHIPVLYWSRGYALGSGHCTADSYIAIAPERLAGLKAMGTIPATIPDAPSLTIAQRIPPVIVAGLVTLVLLTLRGAEKRRLQRARLLGDLPDRAKRLLDILAHAASLSKMPHDEAVVLLVKLTGDLAGTRVAPAMANVALTSCLSKPKPVDARSMAVALAENERAAALDAVKLVLSFQPDVPRRARAFARNLAYYLNQKAGRRLAQVDLSPVDAPQPQATARPPATDGPPTSIDALTTILAGAVHQFGANDRGRITLFASIVGRANGRPLSIADAEVALANAPRGLDDAALRALARGLSTSQRELALTGAAMLAYGSNGLSPGAEAVLHRMGTVLALPSDRARDIIAKAA